MSQVMKQAEKLFLSGNYNELKQLFEKELEQSRQKEFEQYIKKGMSKKGESSHCLYGVINGNQVFTNGNSFYIMNNPFVIQASPYGEGIYLGNVKAGMQSEEQLSLMLEKLEQLIKHSEMVCVDEEVIGDTTITIASRYNEVAFNSSYIMQLYGILGQNATLKLENSQPILTGENHNGKAYVLGLKKIPSIEVRRLHVADIWEE